MNKSFRKWMACAIAVTMAVYYAPYSVEALEVIGNEVRLEERVGNTSDMTQVGDTEKAFIVEGTGYTYKDGVLTISSNATNIMIKGNGTETTDRIVVEAGFNGTITIENLNINVSEIYEACAFEVQTNGGKEENKKTKLTLELVGENSLVSGENRAGLKFSNAYIESTDKDLKEGEHLIITGDRGKLTATGGDGGAGIGGGYQGSGNNIEIIGGEVTATGGENGAGIGGGDQGSGNNIEISGGTVIATGVNDGAGIGGGWNGNGNNIEIIGGEVTAQGGENGAGIGGGWNGNGNNIEIRGGRVTANGGNDGAGIGGGDQGSGNNIEIRGGTVKATGGENGAGIGVGDLGSGSNIEIIGGEVTAIGGKDGVGIGGGWNGNNIEIRGGTVKATGGENGIGIDVGYQGSGKNIVICGGSVKASISMQPMNKKEAGDPVYLVELTGQSNFGSVEVDGVDYKVSANHKNDNDDTIDTTLYLYMTKGKHSIKTNNGWYVLELKEDNQGNVVLNGDIIEIKEDITEKLKNISGYSETPLSNIPLPTDLRWKYDTTKLGKSGKYEAVYTLNGVEYPIFIDITVKQSTGGGGSYIPPIPTYYHTQIIGSDRYETAGLIADKLGSYETAVLVNAESSMSDGLSASGLAGKEDAAILLTKKDSIPKATMDRLKKVKKVYIIGGENAISKKVSDEITKSVPNVKIERLGGKTRVETSELVAKEIGNYDKAFVVNGFKGEADAISASSVAAREDAPILLTNGKDSTHAKKSGVEYYVIGGDNVVDKSIAEKYNAEVLAGKDRYETNRKIITEFYGESETLYFANGETLVDALTASTIVKKDGLVLVGKNSDNEVLNKKNTIQVGGMKFDIDFEK